MTIQSRVLRLLQSASLVAAFLQSSGAFGLPPDLRISQLYHTSWTAHDGAPTGIENLAQTSDGYLWLAASAGLFRFDGVRFERIDEVGGERLPSNDIMELFAPRSGGLWVGYRFGGVSIIRDGLLTNFGAAAGLEAGSVTHFAQDAAGVLWATTTYGLKRFNGSLWQDVREELNLPSEYVRNLRVARDGSLWVVIGHDVMVLRRGQPVFSTTGIQTSDNDEVDFVQTPDGMLWLTDADLGTRALYAPGGIPAARQDWIALRNARDGRLLGKLVDRDGTLWMASSTGIRRLKDFARLLSAAAVNRQSASDAPGDAYSQVDGLSASLPTAFLEDREGNVWVGTAGGLDRFREARLTPVELPGAFDGYALAAGDAGAMLVGVGSADGLFKVTESTVVREQGPQYIGCAYRADDGTLWVGGRAKVWHSSGSKWVPVSLPVDQANADYYPIQAITQDHARRLWVSVIRDGVRRLEADGQWTRVADTSLSLAIAEDGSVWLGYPKNRIVVMGSPGNAVRELSLSDGLDMGNIQAIHPQGAHVWVGGELGLARFDGQRFQDVTLRGGRSLSSVSGIVVTPQGDLWLSTSEGAIKIAADEARQLLANPRHPARYDLFNFLDGMPGTPTAIRPLPTIAAGSDGRLWFATTNGIVWLDPKQARRNTLAPNVEVQAIVADDRRYQPEPGLQLPINVRNLQIEYTALSLSIPERVRFRYQLGAGEPWQDAGPRRTAYFTDLGPGDYRFRVTAANNDGVWNETGASIDLTSPPAFYQTYWFYAVCALASLGLLTLMHKVRMRQVAAQLRGRLEARLAERERIARDLHDTLLQGMQGLIWRFQAATDRIPADEPARQLMEQSLGRADKLLGESRDKVKELRPASDVADLAPALAAEGEQLPNPHSARFRVIVQGTRRDLHPIVREEGFLFSREALSNAFRHAHADNIEAEVTYGGTALHIRIRDDGQGISDTVLDAGERPGHFGLIGMRERAKKLGAHLDVWSKPGEGTEFDLRVPANVAYIRPRPHSRGIRALLALFGSSARQH